MTAASRLIWRQRTDVWREPTSLPRALGRYQSGDGSGGAISPLRAALSAHAAVFYRPQRILKMLKRLMIVVVLGFVFSIRSHHTED